MCCSQVVSIQGEPEDRGTSVQEELEVVSIQGEPEDRGTSVQEDLEDMGNQPTGTIIKEFQ